jgi:hypothetical protein
MLKSTTVFPFERLPLPLFQEVQEFLDNGDYADFMRSSKDLFEDVKRETYRLTIRSRDMEKFLSDSSFRDYVLSKIKDPRLQLCLTYSFPARVTHRSDLEQLFTVCQKLVMEQLLTHPCQKLVLKRNTSGIKTVPGWIDYLNQRNFVRLERNDTVENFQGLESLKHLWLQEFNALSDVSHFTHLSSLCLRRCPLVKDISALKSLKKVVLEFCDGIEDISPLGRVSFIAINTCENITRISCLTQNEEVYFWLSQYY